MAPRGSQQGCQRGRSTSVGGVGAVPTPPTPHRKVHRPGDAWNGKEEDIVKRTRGGVSTRGSRQKQGMPPAYTHLPVGEGAS